MFKTPYAYIHKSLILRAVSWSLLKKNLFWHWDLFSIFKWKNCYSSMILSLEITSSDIARKNWEVPLWTRAAKRYHYERRGALWIEKYHYEQEQLQNVIINLVFSSSAVLKPVLSRTCVCIYIYDEKAYVNPYWSFCYSIYLLNEDEV